MQISIKEQDLTEYFCHNYMLYGFNSAKRIKSPCDIEATKNNKKVLIEIEKDASNFLLHKHDIKKIDLIYVLNNDTDIGHAEKIRTLNPKHVTMWLKIKASSNTQETITTTVKIEIDNQGLLIRIPEPLVEIYEEDEIVQIKIKKIIKNKKVF